MGRRYGKHDVWRHAPRGSCRRWFWDVPMRLDGWSFLLGISAGIIMVLVLLVGFGEA